jgi:nitrous oxidase accessory protein
MIVTRPTAPAGPPRGTPALRPGVQVHRVQVAPAATRGREFWRRTALALGLLLFALLLRAPDANGAEPGPREIRVGAGEQVRTIREALEIARDGDRILIGPGVYAEAPIEITRSVALIGEGYPVLDGRGEHAVIIVRADGVELRGLEIRNTGVSHTRDNAAIRFSHVTGCVAADNVLDNNFFGIYLERSRHCEVSRNVLRAYGTREASSGNGIHLWNSSDVRIDGNRIQGHRDGIYLEFAERTVMRDNVSEDNLRYGLHFMFSNETEYSGNAFRRNGAGVAVMYTKRVTMRHNLFEDNWGAASYGLLLKEITDSEIAGNTFRRNTVGIYTEGSARIEIRGNAFHRNGWAVRMRSNSRENRFTDNDFIDNAFDVTTDARRTSNEFSQNYWSAYRGYDLTGDGFGDVPFRPVRLFSIVVERTPAALVLLRTFFVDLLDLAERVLPILTPEALVDDRPRMRALRAATLEDTSTAAGCRRGCETPPHPPSRLAAAPQLLPAARLADGRSEASGSQAPAAKHPQRETSRE